MRTSLEGICVLRKGCLYSKARTREVIVRAHRQQLPCHLLNLFLGVWYQQIYYVFRTGNLSACGAVFWKKAVFWRCSAYTDGNFNIFSMFPQSKDLGVFMIYQVIPGVPGYQNCLLLHNRL